MEATAGLLLRAATFALAMAAAVAILARPARNAATPFAAFAIGGIGAFMAASAPGAHAVLGPAAVVFNVWCLATPAAVWMLARVLFAEGAPIRAGDYAAAGALVALTLAGDYGRFRLGPLGQAPEAAHVLLLAGRVASIALLLAAGAHAVAHWRSDLVEARRRLRAVFVAVIACAFGAAAASELVFGGRGAPAAILLPAHVALLALTFTALQFVARGGMETLVPPAARVASPPPLAVVKANPAEAELARRVTDAMAARRLWKRDRLGIADLAAELGTQEYLLRRAINRHLGYRNFNDFLHDYRLREAARRLADPAEAHLPVLTIALDCGYGSIGPFNRAFKARFGVTPSQYRHLRADESLADSGTGAIEG